ncbi:hypothetical protein [Kurthia sibirica]|uniref:Uncharacterized protein n=1 Tax=Kurthia sibirica TaxID=202750 RepID=A0A2U3APQ0_9BACL|nr:hypothetical protein [Kurthia sibirica]PWI26530.1 hypothetical protein DEX24_01835 [Kurthia sibirica]GEK32775.1 hypothetical protein KSI01_03080 [Kurthia sibirica]
MKLAALLNNRFTEVEARKKLVTSKSADDAYRKNAKYFTPTQNPAIEQLMDLLTGKKELENQPEIQQSIDQLKQDAVNEQLQLDVDHQIYSKQKGGATPVQLMLNSNVSVHLLPETGLPHAPIFDVKNAKQMAKERLTEKAIATYTFQMTMAKGGFKILQPMIYRTA